MKAAIRSGYGPPSILSIQEVSKPEPKPNEALVRVHAATVNRTDCGVLWGKPYIFRFFVGWPSPRHASTGTDFAGIVEAIGEDVTQFKPGDRVWGFHDHGVGSHAEYIVIAADGPVLRIPDGISFQQAAASAEGGHYAYNTIRKIGVMPGDAVLVYGATGAIGSAAIQLLKAMDVRVTAVCGSVYTNLVKGLGPDRVVDYQRDDFTRDAERYDFVIDAVGKSSFGVCKALLKPSGGYVSTELGPGNENLYLPLVTAVKRGKQVYFPIPTDIKESMAHMQALLEAGRFRPLMDRTYTLERLAEAFEYVNSGRKVGNVVLSVKSEE